ncbi:hypothetical protein ACUY4R_003534 [Kosakonia sp. BK9b]
MTKGIFTIEKIPLSLPKPKLELSSSNSFLISIK